MVGGITEAVPVDRKANCTTSFRASPRGGSMYAYLLEGPTSALPVAWVLPCLLLSSPADGHEGSPTKLCDEPLTPVPWDGPRAWMDESLHTLIFNFRSTARLFSRMTVSVCTSSGGAQGFLFLSLSPSTWCYQMCQEGCF